LTDLRRNAMNALRGRGPVRKPSRTTVSAPAAPRRVGVLEARLPTVGHLVSAVTSTGARPPSHRDRNEFLVPPSSAMFSLIQPAHALTSTMWSGRCVLGSHGSQIDTHTPPRSSALAQYRVGLRPSLPIAHLRRAPAAAPSPLASRVSRSRRPPDIGDVDPRVRAVLYVSAFST